MKISTREQPIKVVLSSALQDRQFVVSLQTHLMVLQRQGIISVWSTLDVLVGDDEREAVANHFHSANIILLCLSSDYVASDDLYQQMQEAMEMYDQGGVEVIPILLRPVDWQDLPCAKLQALPQSGRFISLNPSMDDALLEVVEGVKQIIDNILHPGTNQSTLFSGNNNMLSTGTQVTVRAMMTQGKFEKEAIAKNITADTPIQDLQDDRLGFDVYALAFGEFIASQETSTPLTIGIHGSWGSGKSSLMRLIEKQIDRPLTFRDRWSWVTWLFFFVVTLPFWLLGHAIRWVGHHLHVQANWYQKLSKDIAYDPSNPKSFVQQSLQAAPLPLRFWQKIATYHSPREPLSHPTVWFNAWKFDQEEQLWAALALEVLSQIQGRYNFLQRGLFGLRLALKRFSWLNFLKAVVIPLLLALIDWVYTSYAKALPNVTLPLFGYHIALGQFVLWAGIMISTLLPIFKLAKDPFNMNMTDVLNKPNYKDKVGFIGNFTEDFSQIVALVTKPRLGWKARKLVIFIDDLDRCQGSKAADIVEGINLFLDSQGCVFVLGMDLITVAASIEIKYKDIFDKLRQDDTDMLSPGRMFLDKIIQVPFQVPPSTKASMLQLVDAITHGGSTVHEPDAANMSSQVTPSPDKQNGSHDKEQTSTTATNTKTPTSPLTKPITQPDPASYKLKNVSDAIKEGASYLLVNPRQIKRFVNLFRLYIYIVEARGLLRFEEDNTGKSQKGITLMRLAIWVAWSMRWPEIARSLQEEAQLSQEELRAYLKDIASKLDENGIWIALKAQANDWSDYNQFVNVVNLRLAPERITPPDWCHLPWYQWLREKDFLQCIKQMESFWHQPDASDEDDLDVVLTLHRTTLPTSTDTTPSGGASGKTGKLSEQLPVL